MNVLINYIASMFLKTNQLCLITPFFIETVIIYDWLVKKGNKDLGVGFHKM